MKISTQIRPIFVLIFIGNLIVPTPGRAEEGMKLENAPLNHDFMEAEVQARIGEKINQEKSREREEASLPSKSGRLHPLKVYEIPSKSILILPPLPAELATDKMFDSLLNDKESF